MRYFILSLVSVFSFSGCAPRALYFHESTKFAFAGSYNTSDSQPVATSFGYKRRIVAVVPGQERIIPEGGSEKTGTNKGEALSLVSKFQVRAGAAEGAVIINNFASGMAARIMTSKVNDEAINVMMHSAPIRVSEETGRTIEGNRLATDVVAARLARIASKEVNPNNAPKPQKKPLPMPGPAGGGGGGGGAPNPDPIPLPLPPGDGKPKPDKTLPLPPAVPR